MEDVVRGMTEGKGRAREVGVARPPERGGDLGGAPKLAGVDHHVRVRVETRALHRVNELRQVETLEQERLNSRIVPRGEERSDRLAELQVPRDGRQEFRMVVGTVRMIRRKRRVRPGAKIRGAYDTRRRRIPSAEQERREDVTQLARRRGRLQQHRPSRVRDRHTRNPFPKVARSRSPRNYNRLWRSESQVCIETMTTSARPAARRLDRIRL